MNPIFTGYSGVVWSTVYRTLAYYSAQLSTLVQNQAANANAIALLSEGMLATLLNATQAINAFALSSAWNFEYTNLESIQTLLLSGVLECSAETALYFNTRVATYNAALPSLAASIPQPPFADPSVISSGNPSIPYINLLDYFSTFDFEIQPATMSFETTLQQATEMTRAWNNMAAAILVYQGAQLTQLYDVAQREALGAALAEEILSDFTSGPIQFDVQDVGGIGEFIIGVTPIGGTLTNPWNSMVALPAMITVGSILSSAPFLEQNQQQAVIRNVMLNFASQIELLLLSLRQPILSQASLTTVLVGETLLDVAARATGNFENWTAIATLNGLIPPYTGPTRAPGIAAWGTQVILPTPGSQVAATGPIPSYTQNYLGVDLYIGPINGFMPAWTGDFQTIIGYRNLSWALGRRIQTTQGTLLYHSLYGSRIPPQVGNVQTNETAGHIKAYGESAIWSDPRVSAITNVMASLQPGQLIEFSANVTPGNFGVAVPVNAVFGPVP